MLSRKGSSSRGCLLISLFGCAFQSMLGEAPKASVVEKESFAEQGFEIKSGLNFKNPKAQRVLELTEHTKKQFPDVAGIETAELKAKLATGEILLLDVRTSEEFEVSHLQGAVHVDDWNRDLSKQVVVYCTIGHRSAYWTRKLVKQGVNARNYFGSLLLWIHEGGVLVDRDGATKRIHVYGKAWNLVPEGFQAVW